MCDRLRKVIREEARTWAAVGALLLVFVVVKSC